MEQKPAVCLLGPHGGALRKGRRGDAVFRSKTLACKIGSLNVGSI